MPSQTRRVGRQTKQVTVAISVKKAVKRDAPSPSICQKISAAKRRRRGQIVVIYTAPNLSLLSRQRTSHAAALYAATTTPMPLPPFCFIPQSYRFFVQPENLNNSCSLDFSSDFTNESLCEHPLTLFQKACPFSDTLFETVSLLGVLPPYAVALLSPIGCVCVVKYRPPFGIVVVDDFVFVKYDFPG